MSQLLKDNTEKFLESYISNHPDISLTVGKTSTGLYHNAVFLMRIYYRNDAIRIEVKPETNQYGEYEALVHDKLVYQKGSASPYATNNLYAFFVDKENIETVLIRLIESDSIPTEEQIADYTANSQRYKAEMKKTTAQ